MTLLRITRGLPASGKTTIARAWTAEDRKGRARVNRDDLRDMLDDGQFIEGVTEHRVVAARDAAIAALLGEGVDVISDDTNLPQRVARDLARLARAAGADFEVIDLTDVPLDECLARNAARTDKPPIPEKRIREMHARYLAGRAYPMPLPEETAGGPGSLALYEPKPGTPRAVLVDIDGTAALMAARSPFDETRVHEDRPNVPVITAVRAMSLAGHRVVFVSGRTDGCRDATEKWLAKAELFDIHIRDRYDVAFVIDDRRQVVDMWRSLGLTVLQCADGNF